MKSSWLHNRGSLMQKAGLAFADQIILSAGNFLISILIIKGLDKADYGLYALAIALQMFLISLQNAIVTTPLAISFASQPPQDRPVYIGSLFAGQNRGLLAAALLTAVAVIAGAAFQVDDLKLLYAASFVFAAAGILTKEFLRALFFAQETPQRVLKVDAMQLLLYLALIFVTVYAKHFSLSLLWLFAGFSSFAAFFIVASFRQWRTRQGSVAETYADNWSYGKWSLLGVVVTHLQNYSHLYVIGALLGGTAVADVSASRLLLMPMALLLAAWGKIVLPLGARMRQENKMSLFFRQQGIIALALVIATMIYAGGLAWIARPLAGVLFTPQYVKSLDFIMLWGAIFSCTFANMAASYGLQVLKKFKIITQLNSITLAITLSLLYLLAPGWQVRGALWAVLAGEAALAVALWFIFAASVFNRDGASFAQTWPMKRAAGSLRQLYRVLLRLQGVVGQRF